MIPAVLAIPLGIYTLAFVDPRVLKILIAVFLIFYGGFFILRGKLPAFDKPMKSIDALIGGLGGFLGGLAGLSGALPAMWVALRPWKRQTTRAVLQPFNIIVLGTSAAILAFQGIYSGDTLIALAIALPIALIGSQIGLVAFKRISDTSFRWLLIGLMLCSGLILLLRTVY